MTQIPGPSLHPKLGLYGNLIEFYQDPIAYMVMLKQAFGNLAGIAANHSAFLFLFGAEANQALLMNPDAFSLAGAPPAPGLAHIHLMHELNISHMTGSHHHEQRQILRQALQAVDRYKRQTIMNQVMALLLAQVESKPLFDLVSALKRLLFYMDWQLLFSAEQDFYPLQEILMELTELTGEVSFYAMKPDALPRLNRKLGQLSTIFHDFTQQVTPSGPDLYSILSQAQTEHHLTQAQLLGHLYTLYTASHDTTSSALISTFILILLHPHVWPRLHDEIQTVLGNEPLSFEQLGQLKFLESLILESLRILPASSILARYCQQDTAFKGVMIPKGATCFLSQYITHRDPTVFADPTRYLPERWDGPQPGRYDFIPFGTGFHRCLGAEAAMAKMKTILALFFQRFGLSLMPHTTLDYQLKVTLYPKQEVLVKAHSADVPIAPPLGLRGNVCQMVDLGY